MQNFIGGNYSASPETIKIWQAILDRAALSESVSESISLYRCHPQDLYDFMGWLTTRKERLVLSATDNAAPAAEAVAEYLRLHPEIEQGITASPSDARDAARLDWIERQLQENSGVYFLPSSDTCFIQIRTMTKDILNQESKDTLRAAIDAAIEREGGA